TTWAWGTPTSGPYGAHSGVSLWTTNPSGTYSNSEDGYLTSPVIDLSAYSGEAVILNWWQWYYGEGCCDYISVEVSNNGGSSWAVIYGPYNNTGVTASAWARQTANVGSGYAVSNFRFRLHFTTDSSVVYDGWYVDDFCVATVPVAPATYTESFDAGNGGYTASGTTTWAWGAPSSGPYAAHSGSYLWGTNLSGTYTTYEEGYVTSSNIDLSSLSAEPGISVSWWSWYAGESCCDYGAVDVSNNGGGSWSTVWGPTYAGSTGSWANRVVSLSAAYATSSFRMRFHFHSDSSVQYDGWYVDDVAIGAATTTDAACEP
ncbi:MAG: immune inhibitor A, partial [Proteobacteria bacterium]|nr:immune inhibitor A [Pseudomonadota bacterium]